MAIKKRISADNRSQAIENLANELADRPYGKIDQDNTITRTTITLPTSVFFQLEDMAKLNKRKKDNLRSVSAIIRNCIKETLNL